MALSFVMDPFAGSGGAFTDKVSKIYELISDSATSAP
jgi:hypothetical protein